MENNTAIQEDSTTSVSLGIACLAVLLILLLAVPILFSSQIPANLSAKLRSLPQLIRNESTKAPHHSKTKETSRLEEELVHAQNTVAMLEQEITDERGEHAALQTETSAIKEENAMRASVNLALWDSKKSLQARYKDLLARNDELTAHNHNLNAQNRDLSLLNAHLMQFVRDLEERNEHLEWENANWKTSLRALHAPPLPRPVLRPHPHPHPHPHPTPSAVSSHTLPPTPLETALRECLLDLAQALSSKEECVGYLKEEIGDFEAEIEWRDEMIEVVEEELKETKEVLEWYEMCAADVGRWALWEGERFEEGGGRGDEDRVWKEYESEFGEVVLRDFDGVEEGAEDLGWEYVEVV
jgi:FtsZ-binding cell division protein ZapB